MPSGAWQSICWAPELNLLAAVGQAGEIATSPDGINWTARSFSPADGNSQFNSICWASQPSLFVAVGAGGTTRFVTSPDGITWTASKPTVVNASLWLSICWSSQLNSFAAVGNFGALMTSP
jgi:photosystem II stability/assembly factor-like uncharacterized protein